ncbi:MAG TPA: hypothetical protein VHF67_10640 [Gaiellaceae bacterium]|jgi:hypothetical protein|nr:hypothetical protein [Gaiellaceae bacterium]
MTDARDESIAEITDEELAAAAGEPLPDRAAMSTIGFDPSEFGIVPAEPIPPVLGPDDDAPPPEEQL